MAAGSRRGPTIVQSESGRSLRAPTRRRLRDIEIRSHGWLSRLMAAGSRRGLSIVPSESGRSPQVPARRRLRDISIRSHRWSSRLMAAGLRRGLAIIPSRSGRSPQAPAYETLEGHFDSISSMVVSPDGRWLASGSRDHTVKIWEVATSARHADTGAPWPVHLIDGRLA